MDNHIQAEAAAPDSHSAFSSRPRELASLKKLMVTVVLMLFCAGWATYELLPSRCPLGTVGCWYSDHTSHFMSTVLFFYRGIEVYTQPIAENCVPSRDRGATSPESALRDVCNLPDRAIRGKRPLSINWSQFPRPYPPGVFIYSLPEALLYEFTDISLQTINKVSILKYLVVAHVLMGAFIFLFWRLGARVDRRILALIAAVVLPLLYISNIQWALLGFYDGVAVLFGLLGIIAATERRYLAAIAWLCAAVFFHFRGLWIAVPVGVLCVWEIAKARAWRQWGPREVLVASGAVVMMATATITLYLLLPYLQQFPASNPLQLPSLPAETVWGVGAATAAAAVLLAWNREPLILATIFWQLFMLARTPQVQQWHWLALLPLFGFINGRRPLLALGAVALICAAQAIFVFDTFEDFPAFLARLVRREL